MTSNEVNNNFVTVEMFNAGVQEIKSEIRELRQEINQGHEE